MLHFNELRITSDGKQLIIDAGVDGLNCFDDVTLGSIVIDDQDTYTPGGPSSKPLYTYDIANSPISGSKTIRLTLTQEDLNTPLNSNMFFVYIVAEGQASAPCDQEKGYTIGTVVNLYPLYQKAMGYVKEVQSNCCIPQNFIDSFLRFKALELCIRTGNYIQAIQYWNKYFKPTLGKPNITNCSCYG